MGAHMFKGVGSGPKIKGPNSAGLTHAVSSIGFAGRSAGSAANKDVGAAMALSKLKSTQTKRDAAYAPGPKKG